jgi:hypothetical protein
VRTRLRRRLICFLTELPPGRSPNYGAYKGFNERHPEAPWPRSFERYGGFSVLREEAQRELRRRRRAASNGSPAA